jgi:hypothetical protein
MPVGRLSQTTVSLGQFAWAACSLGKFTSGAVGRWARTDVPGSDRASTRTRAIEGRSTRRRACQLRIVSGSIHIRNKRLDLSVPNDGAMAGGAAGLAWPVRLGLGSSRSTRENAVRNFSRSDRWGDAPTRASVSDRWRDCAQSCGPASRFPEFGELRPQRQRDPCYPIRALNLQPAHQREAGPLATGPM